MATRIMSTALSTASLGIALSLLPAATTTASSASSNTAAQPMSNQTSTVFDPVGDPIFNDMPAFQDFVRGRLTKTTDGDFEFLIELAAPVPVAPPLPPRGHSEIWWFWSFDLDPTTSPEGYPWQGQGTQATRAPEFMVYVSWNGTEFVANAIDRRPLLAGGDAIVTPLIFSINGTIVEAVLPSELIGAVPASFHWGAFTGNWAGPVGSSGFNFADYCEARVVFNP